MQCVVVCVVLFVMVAGRGVLLTQSMELVCSGRQQHVGMKLQQALSLSVSLLASSLYSMGATFADH
jgi:hypothetical protein